MYSSPRTPAGTGRRASSRTYTRKFAMGVPIGGTVAPLSGALMVAQTVVSVGP